MEAPFLSFAMDASAQMFEAAASVVATRVTALNARAARDTSESLSCASLVHSAVLRSTTERRHGAVYEKSAMHLSIFTSIASSCRVLDYLLGNLRRAHSHGPGRPH